MSRPRSRSPHYRRFPWEEPDFDPHKVLEELDGYPQDQSHHFRRGPEDPQESFRDEMYQGGQRIPPLFPGDTQFGRRRHPDQDLYRRSLSPHRDGARFESLPPVDDADFKGRRRGGFREDFQSFENREANRLSSPLREAGMGWRRQERGRGRNQGRFEDFNPGGRPGDPRAGNTERGRRNTQGPFKGRQRENPHHERGPAFKRPRGEMDDVDHSGYGGEEDLGDRGNSADRPRGGFGGRTRGNLPQRDTLVFEHDHGIAGDRNAPPFYEFEDRRHQPNFDRQRSRSKGSSQERFRTQDGRLDNREERYFQDSSRDSNYRETRRSPNTMRYGNQDGPVSDRGRWGSNQGQSGSSFEPPRDRPRYQNLPHDDQRTSYQTFRDDFVEKEPNWANEDRHSQWEYDRPRSWERNLRMKDVDPKTSGQSGWEDRKNENMTIVTEETLTIKVDMSRPASQTSSLCYSSDRQLSFDLVNVGRQRLDFLPMLKHSGTYRETEMHTGAFAQEIISLVHHVKDQYFRGDGLTLNQRFSTPQKGFSSEEELTLNQRFSSNRGFSLNSDSLLDDDEELLFFRLDTMQNKQPSRGPGDLRHDLERRRQEKLEAVKVTIAGSGPSQQRSHGAVSEPDPTEHEGFWTGEQNRRREGNMGPRRGASNRPNPGQHRWNHRSGNQRQNPAGPSW